MNEYKQRMFQLFGGLKDHTKQKYGDTGMYDFLETYTLEYLIDLVAGCLDSPDKEGRRDHSCGVI